MTLGHLFLGPVEWCGLSPKEVELSPCWWGQSCCCSTWRLLSLSSFEWAEEWHEQSSHHLWCSCGNCIWSCWVAELTGLVKAGVCCIWWGYRGWAACPELLLNKAQDAVNTSFLSELVPLLASFFIALSFVPWLHLLFATILKTHLASLAFSFGTIWLVKLGWNASCLLGFTSFIF